MVWPKTLHVAIYFIFPWYIQPFNLFTIHQSQKKCIQIQCAVISDDLVEMDIVIFSEKNHPEKRKLGTIQDDGRITELCIWTEEPAYGNYLEFLVDEEDLFPGYQTNQIILHSIIPQDALSYGSRQIGGGMGPRNPHGQESEMLYYIDRSIISDIEISVKPELEIFW